MKIEHASQDSLSTFADLKTGDVFSFGVGGDYWIKISNCRGAAVVNCFSLSSNCVGNSPFTKEVIKYNATLKIEKA